MWAHVLTGRRAVSRRKSRRPPGRPTILVAEVHDRIVQSTTQGAPMWAAAEYAGVSYRAFERWLARGHSEDAAIADGEEPNPDEKPYLTLYRDVQKARAKATVANAALIQRAAVGGVVTEETTRKYVDPETGQVVTETTVRRTPPDWKAAAWWLERRDSGNFGRGPSVVEVTGAKGGPIEVGSAEQLASRIRANIAAAAAGVAALGEGTDIMDAEVVEEPAPRH